MGGGDGDRVLRPLLRSRVGARETAEKQSGKFLSDIKLLMAQKVLGWAGIPTFEEQEAGARRLGIPGGVHRVASHSPTAPASASHLCPLPSPCGSTWLGMQCSPPHGRCPGSREAREAQE